MKSDVKGRVYHIAVYLSDHRDEMADDDYRDLLDEVGALVAAEKESVCGVGPAPNEKAERAAAAERERCARQAAAARWPADRGYDDEAFETELRWWRAYFGGGSRCRL